MNLILSIWLSDGFTLIASSSYYSAKWGCCRKEKTFLFFFHQQNIHDEQKMRTQTTCTEYFIWSIHHFIKIMDIKLFRDS